MAKTKLALYDNDQISFFKADQLAVSALAYIKNTAGNLVMQAESGAKLNLKSSLLIDTTLSIGSTNGTLYIGNSGDTINLNVSGVTYNIGTLTGSPTFTGNITTQGSGTNTFSGTTVFSGTVNFNGTTVELNVTTLTIDDKNIDLGSVTSPTDVTANGGGITLKGATDKTLLWDSTNANWTSSEHWNLATGRVFKINNVSVLSNTTLGSSVVTSSLTSVGALSSGSIASGFGNINIGSNTITSGAINGQTISSAASFTGSVVIGTSSSMPSTNLDVRGSLRIGTTGTTYKRFYNVASYENGGSTSTGTMVIKVGHAGAHVMVKVKISGRSYGTLWDIVVSGYLYSTYWHMPGTTVITGNPPFSVNDVRLTANSTGPIFYIFLGTTSTVFNAYTSVSVDVEETYANNVNGTGWTIQVLGSEPTITHTANPVRALFGTDIVSPGYITLASNLNISTHARFKASSGEVQLTNQSDAYSVNLRLNSLFAAGPQVSTSSPSAGSSWMTLNQYNLAFGYNAAATIKHNDLNADTATFNLTLRGHDAWASATTNLSGGNIYIYPGLKKSGGAGSDGNIILGYNGSVAVGKIGIGTSSPTAYFHLTPPNGQTGFILNSSNLGGYTAMSLVNDAASYVFMSFMTASTLRGYWGVEGSTGGGMLTNSVGHSLVINPRTGPLHMAYGTDAVAGLTITTGNNIGIGTITAGAKLTVGGNVWLNQTADYGGAASKVQISAGSASDNVIIRSNTLYLYSYGNTYATTLYYGNGSGTWQVGTSTGATPDFTFWEVSGSTTRLTIKAGGNVGIGTTTPGYKLDVTGDANISGHLYASVKHFRAEDPTNPNHYITYSSLEGPENAVFYRGRIDTDANTHVINLPKEWAWLVDEDSISVFLTAEESFQNLSYTIGRSSITIKNSRFFSNKIKCSYLIMATRKDIKPLVVYT